MADETPNKGGRRDADYIALSQDHEVRSWSKKFNITPEELAAAVKGAGSSKAADVEAWLAKNK